jgi:hypothetical protein
MDSRCRNSLRSRGHGTIQLSGLLSEARGRSTSEFLAKQSPIAVKFSGATVSRVRFDSSESSFRLAQRRARYLRPIDRGLVSPP